MLQLVLWFILAAALGAAFGWSVRGGGARHSLERVDQEWATRLEASEAERDRLRRELAAAGERIAALEGALAAARAAGAEPAIGVAGGQSAPPAQHTAAGQPPLRLDAPRGGADDLKRIHGIGPGIERTLNGLGIWHFRQIAELSPENVAWIDRQLRFRGRIGREDWVGQARVLAGGGENGSSPV